jgi:hypothetical protein
MIQYDFGRTLSSEVNKISNGDVRKQWFFYTRNRAVRAQSDLSTVVLTDEIELQCGEIRRELLRNEAKWLSFGGKPLNTRPLLRVLREDDNTLISVVNACGLNAFRQLWPRYEPSKKHGKHGYHAAGGDWVSPMPLGDEAAQEVLMTSVGHGDDRYAAREGEYYRFPRTHPGQDIFHGFSIFREDIPAVVLVALEVA